MSLNVGTIFALLDLDDGPFDKKLKGLPSKATRAGDTMTKAISLPLAGVAVAAGKMSLDFEQVFSRMQGLAGVTADEVDGLKKSVMGLASDTGKGPQELAEALYFIRSAGITGADAMEALEFSAKGAAAGLGSTVEVADAITSAMNAYGPAVLSAAQATDVLVATAREGKAEPAEIAKQFGRLLPVASELGITFNDVGAGLAFLSRSNGDAALSATGLGAVMQKLLKPSQQGAKILAEVGMSTDTIRKSIKDKGLLGTLLELRESMGDPAFNNFLEDSQAITAALALTRAEGEAAIPVFDSLGNVAGSTESAFAKFAETSGFKNQQAFANLQTAMIQIGDIIVPLAADVAHFAGTFLQWFSALPEPVKKLAVVLGTVAAAAGPVLSIGGRLWSTWSKVADVVSKLATHWGVSATSMGRAGRAAKILAGGTAALLVAYAGIELFASSRAGKVGKELDAMFPDLDTGNLADVKKAVAAYKKELDELDDQKGKGRLFSIGGTNVFATNGDADRQERIDQLKEKLGALEGQEDDLTTATLGGVGATKESVEALGLNADAVAENVANLQQYIDKLSALFDPIFGMQDALAGEADAHAALAAVQADGSASAADLEEAQNDLLKAIVNTDSAALTLKASIDSGASTMQDAVDSLNGWVASGRLTKEQADRIATSIGIATSTAEGFAGKYTADVEVHTTGLFEAIAGMQRLTAYDGATIKAHVGASVASAAAKPRAAGGPVWPGQLFLYGENGPELGEFPSNGFIHNASDTRRMLAGEGGGGGDTIIVTVPITVYGKPTRNDLNTLSKTVRGALAVGEKRNGRTPTRQR